MRAVTAESGSSAFSQILCLRQGHLFFYTRFTSREVFYEGPPGTEFILGLTHTIILSHILIYSLTYTTILSHIHDYTLSYLHVKGV